MNLTNFLKQIDEAAAMLSKEQLAEFVHETGRLLPEQDRQEFLRRLKKAEGTEEKSPDEEFAVSFEERYRQVIHDLDRIDSQEITIGSTLNEEYDDWNPGGEEFFYEDKAGIADMVANACEFVHTCVDVERYQEGYEIGRRLFKMEILCDSEYGDEELTLGDLVYHDLLQYDPELAALDAAYCAYRSVGLRERAEALYSLIDSFGIKGITMEAILQHGDEELSDICEFLPLWIDYLGQKAEPTADRLVLEAAGLPGDVSAAAGYARKYAAIHPGLYFDLLEKGEYGDADDMASLGRKALEDIPKNYILRGKAALKTAEYLLASGHALSSVEECYFAAFESDTSAVNYLRALFHGYGSEEKRAKLRSVLIKRPVFENGFRYGGYGTRGVSSERQENDPDSNMLLMLRFLDGQFADVLEKGLGGQNALGWTGTFMKQGIALFLLTVCEGRPVGAGMKAMIRLAKEAAGFSSKEYVEGTREPQATDEDAFFCDLFLRWKEMTPMGTDVRNRAVERITSLLEQRVEGIMTANRRNYYGECAAFIAALGEAQESLGDPGRKQRLMTSYKDKYTRRNAFRTEMKKYGWLN